MISMEQIFKHLLSALEQYLRKTRPKESRKAREGILWFPAANQTPLQASTFSSLEQKEIISTSLGCYEK